MPDIDTKELRRLHPPGPHECPNCREYRCDGSYYEVEEFSCPAADLLDALDAKDREIGPLRRVAEMARCVVNSESVGQPSVDVRAMRELRSRLAALEASEAGRG